MNGTLTALKDIPGVAGSFILTASGELAARDMPSIYKDEIFGEIGRRLNGIAEACVEQIEGLNELLIKFNGCWLLTRRTQHYSLNVLAAESVNFPALKMATNVAVRHIGDAPVSAMALQVAPAVETAPVEPPAAAAAPEPVAAKRRIWRGHVID